MHQLPHTDVHSDGPRLPHVFLDAQLARWAERDVSPFLEISSVTVIHLSTAKLADLVIYHVESSHLEGPEEDEEEDLRLPPG